MSEENGFKVVNVDNSKLERARRNGNLDTGAIMVLESLDLYCEDLKDAYEASNKIEYGKMFDSLQCVIRSALESEKIRNAIMTGIIQDTSKQRIYEQCKKEEAKVKVTLNVEDVTEFAADHNLSETAKYFGVTTIKMRKYLNYHKIDYIKRGAVEADKEKKIRQYAPDMTIKELASLFCVKYAAMAKYVERKGIKCKE